MVGMTSAVQDVVVHTINIHTNTNSSHPFLVGGTAGTLLVCGGGGSDACGWWAALIATLAYGSYGVPIKETVHVPLAHPLILQSYKTLVLLICSGILVNLTTTQTTLFVQWDDYDSLGNTVVGDIMERTIMDTSSPVHTTSYYNSITRWGLLSGSLWVLGGTCGIYAIRSAGMAIAVGTWASVMILVNFVWGILIFHEPVRDVNNVMAALGLLTTGLIGMSVMASVQPPTQSSASIAATATAANIPETVKPATPSSSSTITTTITTKTALFQSGSSSASFASSCERISNRTATRLTREKRNNIGTSSSSIAATTAANTNAVEENNETHNDALSSSFVRVGGERVAQNHRRDHDRNRDGASSTTTASINRTRHHRHRRVQERATGMIAAALNGLLTGSSLIPMHYARAQHGGGGYYHGDGGGAQYLWSLAMGSGVANLIVWLVYVIHVHCVQRRSSRSSSGSSSSVNVSSQSPGGEISISSFSSSHIFSSSSSSFSSSLLQTYSALPSWHLRQLWLPGCMAGILLTIAMFGSILSVTYLGQGIGNSVIQSKILISGLWGILWYREITGCAMIAGWFVFASLTVMGIFWLSQERIIATSASSSS